MADKKITGERIRHLQMRIAATEKRMLVELSEASGLSMADVVRQAIRREYVSAGPFKRKGRRG